MVATGGHAQAAGTHKPEVGPDAHPIRPIRKHPGGTRRVGGRKDDY